MSDNLRDEMLSQGIITTTTDYGPLRFSVLRDGNSARCPLFKNAKGEMQHSGRDWKPIDWAVATLGEMGEAANVLKKIRRGDMTVPEARAKLVQEFADVMIYMDMLAFSCDIDLSYAPNMSDFESFRDYNRRDGFPVDEELNRTMCRAFAHMGRIVAKLEDLAKGQTALIDARLQLVLSIMATVSCIDKLADVCDIDLGNAIVETFNRKSEQLEMEIMITPTAVRTVAYL